MNGFRSVSPEALSDNTFKLIAKDWALIASGNKSSYNMMTANWLGLGFLWRKNVAFVFIRPSRYTYEFVEKSKTMTLNFFTEDYRDILNLCGKKSGRDIDKMNECALTPVSCENGTVAFDEARLILNCKAISTAMLNDFEFSDESVKEIYSDNDYHKMYICEITEAFIKG